MKLLIITQSVDKNNPILGFFHRWIEEFAKHFERVTVICLEKGEYSLPANVKVLSLGKEKTKIKNQKSKLKYIWNFHKYIWVERKNYDAVFVHMNPIYVVLGGVFWKIIRKWVSLWYTHKKVDIKLIVAAWLSNIVFTASNKSLRISSNKKKVIGHGIDTNIFKPSNVTKENIVLSVGRISKTKRIMEMLDVIESQDGYKLQLIGSPVTEDDIKYLSILKQKITDIGLQDRVEFVGDVSQAKLPEYYNRAKLMFNLSTTGSLDKAVLEAMSVGLPVVTTNEAFSVDEFKEIGIFVSSDDKVPGGVTYFLRMDSDEQNIFSQKARNIIIVRHSLSNLIKDMFDILKS